MGTVKFIIDGENEGATVHYWEKFGASANWARLGDPLEALPSYILYTINCTALNVHNFPYWQIWRFQKSVPNAIVLRFWTFHILATSAAAHKKSVLELEIVHKLLRLCAHLVKLVHKNKYKLCTF